MRVERRVVEGAVEELGGPRRRRPGSGSGRRTGRRTPRTAIAIFIGHSRSAMWCSLAGEADVGVLGLAGRAGSSASAWWMWPCSSSLRLLAGLAGDDPEADPERVEGGQQRADVAADREDPVDAAAVGGEVEDLVLREEARGAAGRRRAPGQPISSSAEVNGIALRKPPIRSMFWLFAIAADHRAGRHEEQRLEEGVGHQRGTARPRRRRSRPP